MSKLHVNKDILRTTYFVIFQSCIMLALYGVTQEFLKTEHLSSRKKY